MPSLPVYVMGLLMGWLLSLFSIAFGAALWCEYKNRKESIK